MLTKTIVVLPDTQFPLHDKKLTTKLARFIGEYKPDLLAHVGDVTDSTQLGKWVRGLRGQFNGGLEGGFQLTRDWFEEIRLDYDGPFHIMRSNHDDRLENEIERRMPELAGITVSGKLLNIENALDLDGFGITWHNDSFEIAPGWLLEHGDYGTLSSVPGNTALLRARELGLSVVCGHSHRAGLLAGPLDSTSRSVEVYGMEVGHAMDRSQATYLRGGKNNWHQAFGILKVVDPENKKKVRVYPQLVLVQADYSFMVDGVIW
jgi:predicted phosphodiesterase